MQTLQSAWQQPDLTTPLESIFSPPQMSNNNLPWGEFAIFGLTDVSSKDFELQFLTRLGAKPRMIDFGSAGKFFFYTSGGDMAESDDMIVWKMGTVRSPTMSLLSAMQLLAQKVVSPTTVDTNTLSGNGLVTCFSKLEARFSVYQTLLALPQLYYTHWNNYILCATALPPLLALLDQSPPLNEETLISHFLFCQALRPATYFKDICRLFPGQLLTWRQGYLQVNLAKSLRDLLPATGIGRVNTQTLQTLEEALVTIMATYLAEAKSAGVASATFLSGGVDSSLLQLLFKRCSPEGTSPRSFSFAVRVPSFAKEIEYAQQASQALQTQHTFFDVPLELYPNLLIRTIKILGQPNLGNANAACKMALAEFLATTAPEIKQCFAGQAADALYGISEAKKVALFERLKPIPGMHVALRLAAIPLARWSKDKAHGLQETATLLAEAGNPTSFLAPVNYVALCGELHLARRFFGDAAVLRALEARQNLEAEYLSSYSVLEKIHMIDLLTIGYEPAVLGGQLSAAYRQQLVQFFLDEDVIRLALAFKPQIRFVKNLVSKYILKDLLARHSFSAIAYQKKQASSFAADVSIWLTRGILREMVQDIDLPGFVNRSDFEEMLRRPGESLWSLLTFDLFQKHVRGSN